MALTKNYTDYLDEELKNNPQKALEYLSVSLEEEEPEVFLLALSDVCRALGGMSKISEITDLNRENLYRMLSKNGNPEFKSLNKILNALGFRLAIQFKDS